MDVATATDRLAALLAAPRRYGGVALVLGTLILTLGLGLVLNPTAGALPAFLVLGLLVGLLRWWAERDQMLGLVLPVAAAFAVSLGGVRVGGPWFDAPALDLVIPALVTFLPGAALTMATIELAGRLDAVRVRPAGLRAADAAAAHLRHRRWACRWPGCPTGSRTRSTLGAWAPWLGVFVFAVGHFFASAAPGRAFGWLLCVLYVAYATQVRRGRCCWARSAAASWRAWSCSRSRTPCSPAGAARRSRSRSCRRSGSSCRARSGCEGVTELVASDQASGLGDFVNTLLTVVAIAVGVLVGTGFSERFGRATSRWRGL